MTLRVTTVIPAFNQAAYLTAAIDSLLAQTRRPDEVWIIDDGSTDETPEVALRYGLPVRYHRQENRGLSGARNAGIRLATGELVSFLDADDRLDRRFVEVMAGLLESEPRAVAAYCGHRMMDEAGRPLRQTSEPRIDPAVFETELLRGNPLAAHGMMVRQEVLQRHGGFDEALTACEDWDLWLRIGRERRVVGTPEPLAWYRIAAGSMSDDPARMERNRLAVLHKHLTPEGNNPAAWPRNTRAAFAHAYIATAVEYLQRGDVESAVERVAWTLTMAPWLSSDAGVFYELALGDQLKGRRGDPFDRKVEDRARDLEALLDRVAAGEGAPAPPTMCQARATGHLVMARLADLAAEPARARAFLRRAIQLSPEDDVRRACRTLFLRTLLPGSLRRRVRSGRAALASYGVTR